MIALAANLTQGCLTLNVLVFEKGLEAAIDSKAGQNGNKGDDLRELITRRKSFEYAEQALILWQQQQMVWASRWVAKMWQQSMPDSPGRLLQSLKMLGLKIGFQSLGWKK